MKRGFTLIELLAVIVILAIIALIATPIVLNIINETKESASLRSAEFYMDAVENKIAMEMLNSQTLEGDYYITEEGDLCKEKVTKNNECTSGVIEVEVSGEKPSGGSITITGGSVSDVEINLNSNDKTIVKNEKGELVYQVEICTLISGEEKTVGSKYQCKVKNNMETGFEKGYYFYVLSNNLDGTVNLILDRNICEDGTLTNSNKSEKCLYAYYEDGEAVMGPQTALAKLNSATSDWDNVPNLSISDDNIDGFFSVSGKARFPIYSQDLDKTEITNHDGSNTFLYDNLQSGGFQTTSIPGVDGYWLLSNNSSMIITIWNVSYDGNIKGDSMSYEGVSGIRPVITLKL